MVLAHLDHGWVSPEGVGLFIGHTSTFPSSSNPQPLPASTEPVFTMAMHGVYACFTQTGDKDRRVGVSQGWSQGRGSDFSLSRSGVSEHDDQADGWEGDGRLHQTSEPRYMFIHM